MQEIYELELELNYVIKPKARHRTRGDLTTYNPSKHDEDMILFDISNLLTKSDRMFIETIKRSKNVPIELNLINYYKVTSKKKHGTPKLTTPDVDNTLKLICDSLNSELWFDDRQIFKMTSEKYYAADSKSYIRIKYYR